MEMDTRQQQDCSSTKKICIVSIFKCFINRLIQILKKKKKKESVCSQAEIEQVHQRTFGFH